MVMLPKVCSNKNINLLALIISSAFFGHTHQEITFLDDIWSTVQDLGSLKDAWIANVYDNSIIDFLQDIEPLYVLLFGGRLLINYELFTRNNINEGCFLDRTTESLKRCQFNPNDETKVLIPGYQFIEKPTSISYKIKDDLLEIGPYNIIMANFSSYMHPPDFYGYYINAILVGKHIADQIKFLVAETNASASKFHLIGVSLGGHIAGFAGKFLDSLGRITALDPSVEFYSVLPAISRLAYTDAEFVDVIHVSNIFTGFGFYSPLGSMDFYINGGLHQPGCEGKSFIYADGTNKSINTPYFKRLCQHSSVVDYFFDSIKCQFLAVQCDNYENFKNGTCTANNSLASPMGMFAKKLDVPPFTKFYVDLDYLNHNCK